MRNLLIIKVFFLALAGLAHAQAPSPLEARDTVRQWFQGYEFVPTEGHFKRMGEHLGPALAAIALDGKDDLLARARAVSAMVYAPGPVTEAVLVQLAQADESLLQRKAVEVLALNHGDTHLDLVATVFINASQDLPLREAAARALAHMPGEAALDLRARLHGAEKSPLVKGLLAEHKDVRAPAKATPVGDRFEVVP